MLALWKYAERSVEYLFGARSGNDLAEKIEAALAEQGKLTREVRPAGPQGGHPQEVCHWVAQG